MPEDLDLRVDIAPDAEPDGVAADWTWLDVSDYRRQRVDVDLDQGRDDESGEVEAGSSSITFNLRDGLLSPRNPTSELYGRIGVNTPIRYRLPIAVDSFDDRTVVGGWGTSSGGQVWTATAAHSVNGGVGKVALAAANSAADAYLHDIGALDIDVVYSVSIDAVTTGAPWISAAFIRWVDASNHYRVHTELKPAGVVTIKLVRVQLGVTTDIVEDLSTGATYSAGTKVWTRIVADGGFFRARVWDGLPADEPDTWDITSTLVRVEGAGFGLYEWRFIGNTNVGTLTASVDDLTVDALLWAGNVPEWPPGWDKSGGDSTMSLTAAGPMRRLNQGEDPVQAPIEGQLLRYSPSGYWTLQDTPGATAAASAISGGLAANAAPGVGVTFGETDCPPGATSAARLSASGGYNFQGTITGDTTGNFAALLFVKFDGGLPAGDTVVIEWVTSGSTIRRWAIRANATGWQLKVYDPNGALLHDGGTVVYADAPTEWTAVQLEAVQDGADVDWALIWNRVGSETFWATSGTISAVTSTRLRTARIPSSVGMVDALISNIWAGNESLPFVTSSFLKVFSGYAGELASDRVSRLCAQAGVTVSIHVGDSEPLGVQPAGRFLELLRNSAEADGGVLYERNGTLAYLPSGARVNVPVTMVLDWAAGDLAEAPEPTDDDQRYRSGWTVTRTSGSSATYENAEARRKRGKVTDSAEINIEKDARILRFAEWYTHLTTQDEMRWPSISIDLIAHPELRAQFLACRIGSRIQVVNPKSQIAGVTIDLIIEGIKQTIGRRTWDVELSCSPALPYQLAEYDDTTKRYDSRATTLSAGYSASATTMVVTFPNLGDAWSTVSEPYDWDVAGERITVTSMGAITGAGPYTQSATVTRSVNGVEKEQSAGAPVHIHPTQLARYAR